jgi:hypothetical protein
MIRAMFVVATILLTGCMDSTKYDAMATCHQAIGQEDIPWNFYACMQAKGWRMAEYKQGDSLAQHNVLDAKNWYFNPLQERHVN